MIVYSQFGHSLFYLLTATYLFWFVTITEYREQPLLL